MLNFKSLVTGPSVTALIAFQISSAFASSPAPVSPVVSRIDRIASAYEMRANVRGDVKSARTEMLNSLGQDGFKIQDLIDYAHARLSAGQQKEFDAELHALEQKSEDGSVSFSKESLSALANQLFESTQPRVASMTGSPIVKTAVWTIFAAAIVTGLVFLAKKSTCIDGDGEICDEDSYNRYKSQRELDILHDGQYSADNNVEIARAQSKLNSGQTFEVLYSSTSSVSQIRYFEPYIRELQESNRRSANDIADARERLAHVGESYSRTQAIRAEGNVYGYGALGLGSVAAVMLSLGLGE